MDFYAFLYLVLLLNANKNIIYRKGFLALISAFVFITIIIVNYNKFTIKRDILILLKYIWYIYCMYLCTHFILENHIIFAFWLYIMPKKI